MKFYPVSAEISQLKVAQKLLDSGIIMVHVIRARDGVRVPDVCQTEIVRLNFSYRYMIEDFCVDEDGIRASLSFSGVPVFCDIPWRAVCAISSEKTDQFFLWPDLLSADEQQRYLPPDTIAQIKENENISMTEKYPELRLFAVDSDDDDDEGDDGVVYTPLHFV